MPSKEQVDYKADNAHDLSYKTAWVEGVKGYGIGEYLEYYFKNNSPRVTTIKIFNGYVKSDRAWSQNSRVKKLKLSINGMPFAILNLKDTKAEQVFEFEPLGRRKDGKDLILRFEISDVYKGAKYDDVAITEIYFDGLDVHCFAEGTMILLEDGKEKAIEELRIGDHIKTYGINKGSFTSSKITGLVNVKHCDLVKLIFENNKIIISTKDHPFMIEGKGWCSYAPERTKYYENYTNVGRIEIGDYFKFYGRDEKLENIKLIKIEEIKDTVETYAITDLEGSANFFANGFLVGIEKVSEKF